MKNRMLKVLSVFLVVLVVLSVAPLNNAVVDSLKNSTNSAISNLGNALSNLEFTLPSITPEAQAATNSIYDYYIGTTLTVSGEGKMTSYANTTPDWVKYQETCEKLVIEGDIVNISAYAFKDFTNLKEVEITANLKRIDDRAFMGCTSLENIVMPDSVRCIGIGAFKNCTSLENIVIPDSVVSVNLGAFSGCYNLKSMTTPFVGAGPENVDGDVCNFIGYMFAGTEYENSYKVVYSKSSYYIPYSLKEVTVTKLLNEYNFYKMESLEKVIISEDVEATYFPRNFVYDCPNFKELSFDKLEKFEGIGADAFAKCPSLESFRIPQNVTWIGEKAFYESTNLKNITFPTGDFYVRKLAFNGTRYLAEKTDEFVIEGDGVLIQYNGKNTSVVVPDGIKRISCAFYNRADITDITLPDGLLYLSPDSFLGCTAITELNIPNSVQRMDEYALRGLCGLEKLSIPFVGERRNVYGGYMNSTIGFLFGLCTFCDNKVCDKIKFRFHSNYLYSYFSRPENLTEITINGGSLRRYCLKQLGTIPTVNLGPNVTIIDENALSSLGIQNLNFSSTILATEVGANAFKDNKLTSITFPAGIKKLGGNICAGNDIKTITLNEDLEEIDDSFCQLSISSLVLPKALKKISGLPFSGCENLKVLYIPENVEEIGELVIFDSYLQKLVVDKNNKHFFSDNGSIYTIDGMFFACPPKKSDDVFKIGPSVTGFAPDKLMYVKAKAFVVDEKNEYLKSVDGVLYNKDVTTLIKYPEKRYSKEYVAPQTLKCVESYAFYNTQTLESVKFENDVELKKDCFYVAGFKKLEIPHIPCALKEYFGEHWEFDKENMAMCESLKTLILTNQKSDIVDYFAYGASLETLSIKGNFKSIGENAFRNSQMKEFIMPDSVVIVKNAAFSQCAKLSDLRLSNNLVTIGNAAFYGCPLKSIEFPVSLTSIGDWAFAFAEFEYVELAEYITSVGKCAFGGSDVKKAVINEKLVDLTEEIFQNCINLQIVVLGGNVETIEASAFENCNSLETIVIPDKVNSIDVTAFTNTSENLVIYCNEGSYAQSYAVSNNIKYTTLVLDAIPNQSYTGKAIEPQVRASANGKELQLDSQYKLTFTDNINVGTAKVTARGLGDFKHLVAKGQFAILARQMSDVVVSYNPITYYHPSGTSFNLSLYAGDNKLAEGIDYEVLNWGGENSVGIYNVTVKGINNISGTHNFTVEVLPRSITVTKITKSGDLKVTDSKYILVEGVDYNVEVRTDESGNEETYVVGIGNYTDEKMYNESQTDSFSFIKVIMNMLSKLLSGLFNIFK